MGARPYLDQGTTWTPQLRAEPTTILAMDSRLRWRMCSSVALILAISYTCFKDIVASMSCPAERKLAATNVRGMQTDLGARYPCRYLSSS